MLLACCWHVWDWVRPWNALAFGLHVLWQDVAHLTARASLGSLDVPCLLHMEEHLLHEPLALHSQRLRTLAICKDFITGSWQALILLLDITSIVCQCDS